MEWIILVVVCVGLAIAYSVHANKQRRKTLLAKYGDQAIVDMIMRRTMWQGQTEEQLIDSLGRPVDVDQKVLKTKTKEIWKYNRTGRNRFGLRITLENGVVVGWDKKD